MCSELFHRRFFELSLDLFCLAGANGYFTELNPAWQTTLGWTLEELKSKPLFDFVHPKDKERTLLEIHNLFHLSSKKSFEFENRYLCKNGEYKWLNWTSFFSTEDGCIYAIARDITENKKQQEESIRIQNLINEERTKALHASRMATLGEMASGIAHEINNPLAIIYAKTTKLVETAQEEKLHSELVRNYGERILETALRMSRIVKGLRSFARKAENDPFIETSIKSIVDDCLELCRQRFRNHGAELIVSEISPSITSQCRPSEICQVLFNLLSNALDAVAVKQIKTVKLSVRDEGTFISIAIEDSGSGIPAEIHKNIMQPFFTTKPPGKGTGLGLSISKNIAENHGGRLSFTTSPDGTCFTLTLPKEHK